MIVEKPLSNEGKVTDWRAFLQKAVEVAPGEHKPVLDLFTYHDQNIGFFNMLAQCNPDVLHIYAGRALQGGLSRKRQGSKVWDPDLLVRRYTKPEFEIHNWRRLFSSLEVDDLLDFLPAESINRANIHMDLPDSQVIEACMLDLEPGGGIELVVPGKQAEVAGEMLGETGFEFRQGCLEKLDRLSDLVAIERISVEKDWNPPVKYVIEKPGGGTNVDRTMFWQRVPASEIQKVGVVASDRWKGSYHRTL